MKILPMVKIVVKTMVKIKKITWEFQFFFGLQSLDFIPEMFITAKMSDNGQVA